MLHRSIVFCVAVGFIVTHAGVAYSGSISGSTIEVSGFPNSFQGNDQVTVTLNGFSATDTSDVDVVLVGPTGAALVLLGGAGGSTGFAPAPFNVTFDDTAASQVPTDLSSAGSFKPTQFGPIGSFPAPGPGLAYDSPATFGTSILGNLSAAGVFTNINLNGPWSLYVMDTVSKDSTKLTNGWSLNIALTADNFSRFTNSTPIIVPTVPEPGTLALILFGIASMAGIWLRRSTAATYSRFSIGK
ncbi:MAG TPA: PEP-CTERM sorting domain-containing protein [Pirellulales bacterium]|jgi:hypothetical protein